MKEYVTPTIEISLFKLNDTYAACTLESHPILDQIQVSVHCLRTNKHNIFFTKCTTNYNNVSKLVYNGQTYMYWKSSNTNDEISCDDTCTECNKNTAIWEAIDSDDSQYPGVELGVHVAPVTPQVTSVLNMSS